MATHVTLETGQDATAAAAQLQSAPARLEACLAPAQLAGTLDVLEHAVAGAWSGPYAVALAAGTRTETDTTLAVVTGGNAGHLSGGATAGDLVLGTEYGGGRRVGNVRAGRRARSHTRRTTAQFPGQTLTAQRALEDAADAGNEHLADAVAQAVAP